MSEYAHSFMTFVLGYGAISRLYTKAGTRYAQYLPGLVNIPYEPVDP